MATTATTADRYTRTLGRRKEAVAQIRMTHGTGKIMVNDKPVEVYFPHEEWVRVIKSPFVLVGMEDKFDVTVKTNGGGVRGQADSLRLAIARALIVYNPDFRASLKKQGMLARDARVKERKKYGKKKARRSPQWSKR